MRNPKSIIILVHPFFTKYYPTSWSSIYKLPKKQAQQKIKKYYLALFRVLRNTRLPLILFEEPNQIHNSLKQLNGIAISKIIKTKKASGIPLSDPNFIRFSRLLKIRGIKRILICGSYYAKRTNLTSEQLQKIRNKDLHLHCIGHVIEGLKPKFKIKVITNATLDFTK